MLRVARLVAIGLVIHVDVLKRLGAHSLEQQVFVRAAMQDHAAAALQTLPTQGKSRSALHREDHRRVNG